MRNGEEIRLFSRISGVLKATCPGGCRRLALSIIYHSSQISNLPKNVPHMYIRSVGEWEQTACFSLLNPFEPITRTYNRWPEVICPMPVFKWLESCLHGWSNKRRLLMLPIWKAFWEKWKPNLVYLLPLCNIHPWRGMSTWSYLRS